MEELRHKFGDIHLEIISHKENIRTSCVRRVSDNAVLAYSVVVFHAEGVSALGDEFHNQILSGKAVGETIRNSGLPHERIVPDSFLSKINFGLAFLFDTQDAVCVSRTVDYKIHDLPYASIAEFYNPKFIPAGSGTPESNDDLPIEQERLPIIDQLKPGFEEEYLRLAHGFLKKPMHIGIENQDDFVKETRKTLELLMKDSNTRLFVAADATKLIGYVAINIHPALHINGLECVIRELYVKEEFQRKGIGTMLIEYVGRYAKTKGCKRISLATKWDDEKQKAFYESLGFSRRCDFVIKKL